MDDASRGRRGYLVGVWLMRGGLPAAALTTLARPIDAASPLLFALAVGTVAAGAALRRRYCPRRRTKAGAGCR